MNTLSPPSTQGHPIGSDVKVVKRGCPVSLMGVTAANSFSMNHVLGYARRGCNTLSTLNTDSPSSLSVIRPSDARQKNTVRWHTVVKNANSSLMSLAYFASGSERSRKRGKSNDRAFLPPGPALIGSCQGKQAHKTLLCSL